MKYQLAVIGGGPGGYTAAAKAAEAGLSVVLFERSELGGTCLNRGCIPTKALLHAAETFSAVKDAGAYGITASAPEYDFAAMHARKAEVVQTLRQGVEKLMKAGKVEVIKGSAVITGPGSIECGGEKYEADDIIIATGSVPFVPPIEGADLPGVYTSNDLLEGDCRDFKSLVIIGGGVIGVECASIYMPLGCKVTILEVADHILPPMDKEIAKRLVMFLKKRGATVAEKISVKSITGTPGDMTVTYTDAKGAEITVAAEGVLMATGRRADTSGLFAPGAEPELSRGAVVGDEHGRTSVKGLYVIGDAKAANIQLAHVAVAQAKNTVAVITGKEPEVDMRAVPSCLYTSPEIASVGMTEDEAKAAGLPVHVGKTVTGANGKCLIEHSESGYVKLVSNAETGELLGAQLVCPRATDMVTELALAISKGMAVKDVAAVIHPHPTFSELIGEAAEL